MCWNYAMFLLCITTFNLLITQKIAIIIITSLIQAWN